ncbi:unnamed protein product [Ectocarpus sp. 13 AM-2016]
MSTLFASIAAWDLNPTSEDEKALGSASPTGTPTAAEGNAAAAGWPVSETSVPLTWNSGDLEEMMRGLDSTSRSASAPLLEDAGSSNSPPLSREDLVEERDESVIGFPISRGSSPLYRKEPQPQQRQRQQQQQHHHHVGCSSTSDYKMDHQQQQHLDDTAPSSPCTPSLHMRGGGNTGSSSLSAVSPTSSHSEDAAFQQQLSLEAESRAAAAAPPLSARPSGGVVANNNNGSPSGGRFGLKLLVSNSMAGTLIGKGGTRICEIKDECLADIKVTPNGRFYPGTHERVVLVVGEPGSVQMACDRIVTTIYTAADTSLDITQRVLIPDAASGLIIGHDGVRLGDLRQQAGVASIQVSPRDMCTVAGERVVTLQGPMSSVIHGLTLIVDRMMEDTTASRYQNMSTIYRAVHLHLPPYAVPGMQQQQQQHDNGASPRHPNHPRLSPSYRGPSPHSHHDDYHSPGGVAGSRTGNRGDYGKAVNGAAAHWELGYGGGNHTARELTPHGGGGRGGAGIGAEYVHRNMSMPTVHPLSAPLGSPLSHQHRSHTAPAAVTGSSQHFGGRHLRQEHGAGSAGAAGPRDFDFSERDTSKVHRGGGAGPIDLDDYRLREYDSPSPADLGSRPGSREGYVHHSPHLPGPSPRDLDHMHQQQQQQQHSHDGGRGFSRMGGSSPYPPGSAASQSDFMPLQRVRQQQQESSPGGSGILVHEARAAAAAAQHKQQQQHRGLHDGGLPSSSALHRTSPGSVHGSGGGGGGSTVLVSPPHGGALRQGGMVGGSSNSHGCDASGLSGMFEGMNLNSPPGLAPPSTCSPGSLQQKQQQGQSSGASGGGAGCIVHGELPVPDADVGIILGKGGATVRELQQLSGAKIMIARRNEFMPGTKHRLVTLAGAPLAVNMARFLIMRKIQTEKEKL